MSLPSLFLSASGYFAKKLSFHFSASAFFSLVGASVLVGSPISEKGIKPRANSDINFCIFDFG